MESQVLVTFRKLARNLEHVKMWHMLGALSLLVHLGTLGIGIPWVTWDTLTKGSTRL